MTISKTASGSAMRASVDRPGRRLTGVVGDRFARGGGQCDVEAIEVAALRDDGLDEPAVAVGVHLERETPS